MSQQSLIIADDDPEDLELIEEVLLNIRPDILLHKAGSGKEVISILGKLNPDSFPSLIILDYNMPEMTGVQLLGILNSDDRYKEIPKVILSTSNNPAYIELCEQNGGLGYYVKPNSFKDLEDLIKKIIATHASNYQ